MACVACGSGETFTGSEHDSGGLPPAVHVPAAIPIDINTLTDEQRRVIRLGHESDPTPYLMESRPIVCQIVEAGNGADEVRSAGPITRRSPVMIYALGEAQGGRLVDHGWLEDVATGKRVWEMTLEESAHGGGDPRNRRAVERLWLEPGSYELHYVSNDSHAFGDWRGAPPERELFYGVVVFNLEGIEALEQRLRAEGVDDLLVREGGRALEDGRALEGTGPEGGGGEPELSPRERDLRGDEHLLAGRFEEALADFDSFLAAAPELDPQHWRRGIAYYYAGRYEEGAAQFVRHRRVNPNDVENAAWHFLCLARATSFDEARAALLPVGPDQRDPMREVYALFAGRAQPQDVLAAAESSPQRDAVFFAHLYLGLYYEALGDLDRARRHIDLAATTHARPHYMGRVAKMHAALMRG